MDKIRFLALVMALSLLAACAPSRAAIQTAVAKTQAAIPTTTSIPTFTPSPLPPHLPSDIYTQLRNLPAFTYTTGDNKTIGTSVTSYTTIELDGSQQILSKASITTNIQRESQYTIGLYLGDFLRASLESQYIDNALDWYSAQIQQTVSIKSDFQNRKIFGNRLLTIDILFLKGILTLTVEPSQ